LCIDSPDNQTCYTGEVINPDQYVLALGEKRMVVTPISIEEGWWSNTTIIWVNSSHPYTFINSLPNFDFFTD